MTHDRQAADHIPELIDHLFRRQSSRMLARLCRAFGLENLELAEEVVQEAMLKAVRLWPFQGVPEDPSAWLLQAARHGAIDQLRRRAAWKRKADEMVERLRARSCARQVVHATIRKTNLMTISSR